MEDVLATVITLAASAGVLTCLRWSSSSRKQQGGGEERWWGADMKLDGSMHERGMGQATMNRMRDQPAPVANKARNGLTIGRAALGDARPKAAVGAPMQVMGVNTLKRLEANKAAAPAGNFRGSVRLGPYLGNPVKSPESVMYVQGWTKYKEYLVDFYSLPGKSAMEVGCGDLSHCRGYGKFASLHAVDFPSKKFAAQKNAASLLSTQFTFQDVSNATSPWRNNGKVDCMYFLDSLHNVWDDGKVCKRISDATLQAGFVVVLMKKSGNRTVKDAAGGIVLKITGSGSDDGMIEVTRKVNGQVIPAVRMKSLDKTDLIKKMGENNLGFIHEKKVKWPGMDDADRALADAFTVLVFAKHIPLINKLQKSFKAAGIDHFAIPGGTSFSIHLFKQKTVAPTWLASISDVDTHCLCNERQREMLWNALKNEGVIMNPPSMGVRVGAIYTLHRDVTKELDLSTATQHDPSDAYLITDHKGFYTVRAVQLDLYCMFYLAYTAMFMRNDPSHTRGQKLARLAGKMFCLANIYEKYSDQLVQLDRNFQQVVDKFGRARGPAYAAQKEFYQKNKKSIDFLCRTAFKGVNVREVAETLKTYMPANMGQFASNTDYAYAEQVIQQNGGDMWDEPYTYIDDREDPAEYPAEYDGDGEGAAYDEDEPIYLDVDGMPEEAVKKIEDVPAESHECAYVMAGLALGTAFDEAFAAANIEVTFAEGAFDLPDKDCSEGCHFPMRENDEPEFPLLW